MSVRFRLLTEADVRAVLTMDDLIEAMASSLERFSSGRVVQPVRTVIPVDGNHAFYAIMPAFAREPAALGAKLVTVFGANAAKGLDTHLASIVLLDPDTGALRALLDGRYITEARTAAVSAVSSRLLARAGATSVAIIGSGVQARSHLEALSRVHKLRRVVVWSPTKAHRERFVTALSSSERERAAALSQPGVGPRREVREAGSGGGAPRPVKEADAQRRSFEVAAVEHPGEAVVGADIIVLVTSSPTPVIERGWVKPGAHIICVGACRPNQREIDPDLTARARLFVDSRAAALVESGDVVMGIQEGRFNADHIVAELGELVAGERTQGRRSDADITIFKSLGMAVEDVTAADLAYRRAIERGIGLELSL